MSAHQPEVLTTQDFSSLDEYSFSGNDVTVNNKRQLIEAYRQRGTITHAAATVGVSRKCVHHYINTDPVFAEAMASAHEDSGDILESSVYERAFKSDLLAMFYLKAKRPQFRDRVAVDVQQIQQDVRAILGEIHAAMSSQLSAQSITQTTSPIVDNKKQLQPAIGQNDDDQIT